MSSKSNSETPTQSPLPPPTARAGCRRWSSRITTAAVLLVALVVVFGSDGYREARRAAKDAGTHAKMKELGVAALMYHQTHGSFPMPSTLADGAAPPRSWRVELLPFLSSELAARAHRLFNPSLHWNDPANRVAADLILPDYYSPFQQMVKQPISNYFAVVENGFVMSMAGPTTRDQIKDDHSETILFVEYAQSIIPWADPRDLSFDQFAQYVADPRNQPNGHGFNVLMVDGTTQTLRHGIAKEKLRALFTIDGRETIDRAALFR